MKKLLYSILAIATVLVIASCTKHKMHFDVTEISGDIAEFQLHYMEAVNNVAAQNIDSVFVNGKLYSNSLGSGVLAPYNGIPSGGGGGRFFAANVGSNHFILYRGANVIYERDITLTKGKQNVIIYDLTKDPIVMDNGFPYWNSSAPASAAMWTTDSVFQVQFVNLLYENVTLNPTTQDMVSGTPYPGRLQYQYQRVGDILHPITGVKIGEEPSDWFNMGGPVAFGETTGLQTLIMHKQTFNSSGSQRFNYRILDENGNELMKWNGSKMAKYSDYWNAYIGRVYIHFFRGARLKATSSDPAKTVASPACNVSQWASM